MNGCGFIAQGVVDGCIWSCSVRFSQLPFDAPILNRVVDEGDLEYLNGY
jgi:hypothetical protein